jgi:hypothetical protein
VHHRLKPYLGDDAKLLQQLREVAAASKDGPLQAPLCSLWPHCLLAIAMLSHGDA